MKKVQKRLLSMMIVLGMCAASGCGVSHGSPEGVVKSLIQAYASGKEKKIKDCYGVKDDISEELQAEIDATIKYLDVHNMKKTEIVDCDILSENDSYAYVYITYNLVLEDEQEYPCIGTYMVTKTDKKYYVVPTSEVTSEMSEQAITDYQEFMDSDAYKEYRRSYDTFIKGNPGYEDKIAGKLS
jgi:hypothetical protein